MDIDGQGQQGHGRGHGRGSGSHSAMESTNIAAVGRGRGSPLSLNAMPGDLGSFLTKRSASGDDAPAAALDVLALLEAFTLHTAPDSWMDGGSHC
uniref:Uncharacterized protein n=1 Tax=Oryza punctata TaxID=4537 RepID=A0A0E0MBZ4_ORYPU